MFGLSSGCSCAGCNKPDELFGFWQRRPLGGCADSGFRLELRAQYKNNCSVFGVSGLEFSGLQLWPGVFHLEFCSGRTRKNRQSRTIVRLSGFWPGELQHEHFWLPAALPASND
jgi:hypothetical protein